MSARRAVWEVARRELVERSRSRVMRIWVVVLVLISAGGAVAVVKLSGHTPTDNVGIVGTWPPRLQSAIRAQEHTAGRRVRFRAYATAAAASHAVRDGSVAVALVSSHRAVVDTNRSHPAVQVMRAALSAQAMLDQLHRAGLTEAQVSRALVAPPLTVDVLQPGAREAERDKGLVAVGLMALLIVLVFYGQAVAQGVTEEKSSRVVELLLTTVSPRRLLTGKIVGIGLLGLAQLLLAGGTALLAAKAAGGARIPPTAPQTVLLVVIWFVLGYVFYSVAFAAAGALVSRQEDLQTAMLPVNVLLVGAFYFAVIVVNADPNGIAARATAFVPPLAPMVVPTRMVVGDMGALEFAATIAIDLIATVGLVALAARVYERAILHTGAPLSLRRVFARSAPRTSGLPATTEEVTSMNTSEDSAGPKPTQRARLTEFGLRMAAVVLLIAGVAIGLHHIIAVALVAAGLVLVAVAEAGKHRWRRHLP